MSDLKLCINCIHFDDPEDDGRPICLRDRPSDRRDPVYGEHLGESEALECADERTSDRFKVIGLAMRGFFALCGPNGRFFSLVDDGVIADRERVIADAALRRSKKGANIE